MNCMVLDQPCAGGIERLIIDCGVLFGDEDLGVDVVHPSFDYLIENPAVKSTVVITHGHEDHIGALPFLPDLGEVDIWGPRYAMALVAQRLDEAGMSARLRTYTDGEPVELGGFTVEPIAMSHSIVDAHALAIHTAAGTIVHSGDFKFDAGASAAEARLAAIGKRGVALLVSDSTNSLSPGHSRSETVVAAAIERTVAAAPSRVVVGLFASNVQRMAALGDIASRLGRRVCLLGRSMRKHADVARELGFVDWPSDRVVSPDVARSLVKDKVLYLATGTQGEPRGALRRLSKRELPAVGLEAGDSVVLSSRIIPGHEVAVGTMVGDFLRQGVTVHDRHSDPELHASGHAHAEEQAHLIALTKPRCFVPVHGTRLHLEAHARTARLAGVSDVTIIEDGAAIELAGGHVARIGKVASGRVARSMGREVDEDLLRSRRQMARGGAVFVSVVIGATSQIDIVVRGVAAEGTWREEAHRRAMVAIQKADDIAEGVRIAVRGAIREQLGTRPPVAVSVTRL